MKWWPRLRLAKPTERPLMSVACAEFARDDVEVYGLTRGWSWEEICEQTAKYDAIIRNPSVR